MPGVSGLVKWNGMPSRSARARPMVAASCASGRGGTWPLKIRMSVPCLTKARLCSTFGRNVTAARQTNQPSVSPSHGAAEAGKSLSLSQANPLYRARGRQ
jgi:hypothetical protein